MLLALMIVAWFAATEATAMNKQDFVPPIFGRGPAVHDEAFAPWLAEQQSNRAEVKLPFTIWRTERGEVTRAAIGRHAAPPDRILHLADGALGVPLDERLRQLQPGGDTVVVWLSGLMGEVLVGAPAGDDPDAFSVLAVHELVRADEMLEAWSVRGKDCLAVRLTTALHCARGSLRCEECRAAAAEPAASRLLDLCPHGDAARPTLTTANGARAYEVLRTFATLDEANAFATEHGLEGTDEGEN